MLIIKMFGEFSIRNKCYEFVSNKNHSIQLTTLISYLIANKDTEIPREKLVEILWPEENCANPSGALRNLIYRARQELKKFYPGQKVDCILFSGTSYSWNKNVDCDIDIYQFENYSNLAKREESPEQRFKYNKEILKLYNGDFLPLQNNLEWVTFRNIYYKNLFTNAVLDTCSFYKRHSQYQEIIELCERASNYELLDENIHKEMIMAYLKIGKVQKALDYYHSVTELFSQKYGVDITVAMHDVYLEIIKQLPNHQVDISSLEENLRQTTIDRGSFYCNFDIFKNIYQINLRSGKRSQNKRFLVLVTLRDTRNENYLTSDIKAEIEILNKTIYEQLRSSDVYTQSSYSQFSIILTVQTETGCHAAINRLETRYYQHRERDYIVMDVDIKQIR